MSAGVCREPQLFRGPKIRGSVEVSLEVLGDLGESPLLHAKRF